MSETEARDPSGEPPVRAFATVWFTLFLDLLGFGMILPVLPYYAEHFGASPAVVALLSSTFSLAQFVMSPILGRISDRFGRRKVMLISIAASCGAMIMLSFASALWMVFVARLISGSGNANVSTAHAYIADRVVPEQRARYMGMMGTAIGLGFVFGPAAGGLLSHPEIPSLPFMVAAGLAALNWIMAFFWLPESHVPSTKDPDKRPLFVFRPSVLRTVAGTQLGWLIMLNFMFFLAFAGMESTFALFTEYRFDWGERETGYMFTGIGVVIVIMQGGVVGRLVSRFGEKRTLIAGYAVLSIGLTTAGLSGVPWVLVIGGLTIAAGNGLSMPSANALVSRSTTAEDQGLSLGLASSAAALARIVGPIAAGLLFEAVGEGVPMAAGGGVMVVAVVAAALLLRQPGRESDS